MEAESVNTVHGVDGSSARSEPSEPVKKETVLVGDRKHHSSTEMVQADKLETGDCEKFTESVDPVDSDSGDVNMEAAISADDVMRAGGFGARDDISSFLPVASDSTDFEASLRDARDYEEPQKNIGRPGLGWNDVKEKD